MIELFFFQIQVFLDHENGLGHLPMGVFPPIYPFHPWIHQRLGGIPRSQNSLESCTYCMKNPSQFLYCQNENIHQCGTIGGRGVWVLCQERGVLGGASYLLGVLFHFGCCHYSSISACLCPISTLVWFLVKWTYSWKILHLNGF